MATLSEHTWDASPPPSLPPIPLWMRLRGAVRLVLVVLVTLMSVLLFLPGRLLRRLFGKKIRFHFAVARMWARLSLLVLGIDLRLHGTPIRAGALVANHSTWIDILAIRASGDIYFVSKAEVAKWPGIGFLAGIAGTVFINRRRVDAKRQQGVLRERLAAQQVLCFFPEATSTDGLRVLPFKSALFSAFFDEGVGSAVIVQPVSLRYHTGSGTNLPQSFYGWWGTMAFGRHIWDVMCRSSRGRVDVIYHTPVCAKDFACRKTMAEHCHRAVASGLEQL